MERDALGRNLRKEKSVKGITFKTERSNVKTCIIKLTIVTYNKYHFNILTKKKFRVVR